ncbi:hypothetical protein [Leifsonia sp. AG29]|uniref:hypothetical protein n=1 Tax=Leifsonia sp. AG29 TaxID=2598860 RepID=UPI00131B6E07|nr:hypothetical protein [Leifsonia sp. AG29]
MSSSNAERVTPPQPRGDDYAAVPYLRRLQHISLIRWSMREGEWSYSTLAAQYLRRDEQFWYLLVRGAHTQLRRDEWSIFT